MFLSLVDLGRGLCGDSLLQVSFEPGPLCEAEAWPLVRRRQLVRRTSNNLTWMSNLAIRKQPSCFGAIAIRHLITTIITISTSEEGRKEGEEWNDSFSSTSFVLLLHSGDLKMQIGGVEFLALNACHCHERLHS